jgi:hypothetical protein
LCTAVHFRFLASKALHVPCIMQNTSVFQIISHGLGRKIRYHEMEHKLCAWMVARTNTRVTVTKNMCLALARKWDSASDTEIVWAKSARSVWGLANVSANRKFCFTHDFSDANCLPQGLEPPAKPPAKPAPKLPNLVPNPPPRVQPNLPPRWQPSLQPSQQLESPFLWPVLSMCSSSESNSPARQFLILCLLCQCACLVPCPGSFA